MTQRVRFGRRRAGDGCRRGGGLCAAATARRLDNAAAEPHRAGILQIAWRTTLHDHGLFEPAPEECASGVLAQGRLVIGSRAGAIVGVAPGNGHVDWVTSVSGGVDSEARFDAARGQVVHRGRRRQLLRRRRQDRRHPLVVPRQGRHRTPRRDRPRAGLHRQRRRPDRRARAGDREVALAIRARHARGVHDPRLRRSAPARRSSCCRGLPTATSSRCRRPAARSCGRSRWRRRRTSSSTSIRRPR